MSKKLFNVKDVRTAKDGMIVRVNCYWVCLDGDPTTALFYGESPQCNKDKRICDHSIETEMYKDFSDRLQVILVPVSYIPQREM